MTCSPKKGRRGRQRQDRTTCERGNIRLNIKFKRIKKRNKKKRGTNRNKERRRRERRKETKEGKKERRRERGGQNGTPPAQSALRGMHAEAAVRVGHEEYEEQIRDEMRDREEREEG